MSPTRGCPLDPPGWAGRSIAEDGGVTHERVSEVRPLVRQWSAAGPVSVPTEVSVSVADVPLGGAWVRSEPTVQLEGGCYTLDGVRDLQQALTQLLTGIEAGHDPAG